MIRSALTLSVRIALATSSEPGSVFNSIAGRSRWASSPGEPEHDYPCFVTEFDRRTRLLERPLRLTYRRIRRGESGGAWPGCTGLADDRPRTWWPPASDHWPPTWPTLARGPGGTQPLW